MADEGSDLATPLLLLAMPQVVDPFFHKSVVLLLHHAEEGSFGFIVNRPTGIAIQEVLEGMEVTWQGGDAHAHFGGPVQPQLGTVLFAPGQVETEAATQILPGVSITQHAGDLARLAASPPAEFRLLLGYAGWGAGQLLEEILRNDWLTAPVRTDIVFAAEPDEAWQEALRSVGVDPAVLPSWTKPHNEEPTN